MNKDEIAGLIRDLANTGLAVTKGGKRVDPMDFYAEIPQPENASDALESQP